MKRIKGPNNRAVKLHHPSYRNCMLAIEEPGREYSTPYNCPHCGIPHTFKTHHIILDAHGDSTIHEMMYDDLRHLGLLRDLKAVTEIEPVPQVISHGQLVRPDAVVSLTTGPVRLPYMNGHGRK
jgi:predicted RNA-binding Zn-ribbon protein involved in translation (DUF1610 family)